MKLTTAQRAICKRYSAYDAEGRCHCYECPLVLDYDSRLCWSNARPDEIKEFVMFDGEISEYDTEEIIENCTVQVLSNSETGEVSIGWWRNRDVS